MALPQSRKRPHRAKSAIRPRQQLCRDRLFLVRLGLLAWLGPGRRSDAEAVAELESIAPYPGDQPIRLERIIVARTWPQQYGGMTAYRDAEAKYYYGASLLSPEYDCEDRRTFFGGNVFTLDKVLDEFMQVDFTGVTEFPIPVVMFLGRHDYTTPSEPTAEWLERVEAPYKRGVWFEHASDMVLWEEPGRTLL